MANIKMPHNRMMSILCAAVFGLALSFAAAEGGSRLQSVPQLLDDAKAQYQSGNKTAAIASLDAAKNLIAQELPAADKTQCKRLAINGADRLCT